MWGNTMEKIKTATGQEFDCDFVSSMLFPSRTYIRVCGAPIGTVATVFSSKSETTSLRFGDNVIEGYTNLVAIVPESDAIRIVLGKEATA